MQLLRSMAVTFKFTCVNVVQLLGCGVFQARAYTRPLLSLT